jgi:hypothetical protein
MKYAEEAARGAAFLDERHPGWAFEIDLTRLNMSTCSSCIVGQLFGGLTNPGGSARFQAYDTGLLSLGVNEDIDEHFELGFSARRPCREFLEADESGEEWEALKQAWIAEIEKRKTR